MCVICLLIAELALGTVTLHVPEEHRQGICYMPLDCGCRRIWIPAPHRLDQFPVLRIRSPHIGERQGTATRERPDPGTMPLHHLDRLNIVVVLDKEVMECDVGTVEGQIVSRVDRVLAVLLQCSEGGDVLGTGEFSKAARTR